MRKFLFYVACAFLSRVLIAQSICFYTPTDNEIFPPPAVGGTISVPISIGFTLSPTTLRYKFKLIAEGQTYTAMDNQELPSAINTGSGHHLWRVELYEYSPGLSSFENTAWATASFDVQLNLQIQNLYGAGHIWVNNVEYNNNAAIVCKQNDVFHFESKPEFIGGYTRIWNSTGNNLSQWQKKSYGMLSPITLPGGTQSTYDYAIQSEDNGAIIYADPKRKLVMTVADNLTEINTNQNDLPQASIIEQNSGNLTAKALTTDANGNVYKFSYWPDVLTNVNPRTVTPTDNATYTAVYKALSASATSTAYAEASARKFVRSAATTAFPNGILHNVYESQGQIWYEASTDNGATWNILNGGTPVSGIGNTCLNPSIAVNSGDGNIYSAITYFRAVPGSPGTYQLKMQAWTFTNNLNPSYLSADIYSSLTPNTASGLYAGVELTGTNRVVVLYSTDGWYNMPYWYAQISSSGITNVQSGTLNATSGMRSVSVSASRTGNNGFHVLYQGSNNTIYYTYLSETNGGTLQQTTPRDVSTGSGFTQNHSPSVVIMPDGEPRACWVGYGSLFNYETESSYNENTVVFRGINSSNYFWNFDDQVQQVNINSSINGSNNTATYLVGWVRGNAAPYQNKYMIPTSFSTFSSFNTTGKYLQVCNGFKGNDYNELAAMSFNTGSLPYKFQMSGSSAPQGPVVSEKIRPQEMELYRSGVAFRDSAQFKFRIGGLSVDGTRIAFPEIPDTVVIGSLASANTWLVSNPFEVNNNSVFTYHVFYSPVDTANARAVLGENDQVSFKTQLADANTGEVLGTFDEVSFSRNNLLQYKNGGYEVSTGGIGKRTVVLKISAADNTNMRYAISQKVTSDLADTKTNMMKTSFRGNPVVKKYNVSQNYPNPFNPTTVISYDLPADGHVSLRVYSILGKEVMCLVNEQQTAGSHQVEFNASKLASGIYLYKFECNGYTAVKKMSFMK